MNTYKIGDVVQLKSGGPAMTVMAIVGEQLDLGWHENGTRDGVVIPSETVKLVEMPDITFTRITPKDEDIIFVSFPPGLPMRDREYLEVGLSNLVAKPHKAKIIMSPYKLGVIQISKADAKKLAEDILAKIAE